MRDDLKKKLTVNRAKLVKGLDVTGSFFPELSSNGAITEEHLEIIRAERTDHEQVDKLIGILLRRPEAAFDLFCVVVQVNNPDMFELITKGSVPIPDQQGSSAAGIARNGPDNSLSPGTPGNANTEFEIKARGCYAKITASLDPKGHVGDTLFARGIITGIQLKDMNNAPTPEARAGLVLLHLFGTEHPQAFVVFREALKKDYDWLITIIDQYKD